MSSNAKKLLLSAALLALAPAAFAEDGFSGKASLGYLATSGNSESSSVNAATELVYGHDRWTHTFDASALGADNEGQSIAEAYTAGGKSEWAINDRSYLFGLARWNKDKFSGYDQQASQTVGYGRVLLDNETSVWNVEIGAGARQSDLRDGTSENETVLRAATDYKYVISENSEFNAAFAVESGEENTAAQSLLSIKARLMGDLALVASYQVRYNSEVPVGSEKTDRFTAISLEYAF
ncbi:MAG: YdiY family protein [Woeseiaceae bacterium]